MALVRGDVRGMGEAPGDRGVKLYKQELYGIGYDFTLPISDVYDGQTSAAVLDFRRNAGLPVVDVIDDDFAGKLAEAFDYLAARGEARQEPVPGGGPTVRTEDILVTGRATRGGGLVWLLVAAVGAWAWSRSRA